MLHIKTEQRQLGAQIYDMRQMLDRMNYEVHDQNPQASQLIEDIKAQILELYALLRPEISRAGPPQASPAGS